MIESERAKSVVDLDMEKLPTESALGLEWNTEDGSFVWDVAEKLSRFVKTEPVTRRYLLSLLMECIDRHAPLRHKRVGNKRSPWITNQLQREMRKRDYLKQKAIREGNSQV